MNYKALITFGIILFSGAAAMTGTVIYQVKKLSKKFDKSVSELSDAEVNDIKESIIENAVKEAADRNTENYIEKAGRKIVDECEERIDKHVKEAVSSAEKDIREKVSDKISQRVNDMDLSKLEDDIKAKSEKLIMDKFNNSLNGVLGKFNDNLDNVHKIYSSIADTLKSGTKNDGKNVTFNI